MSFPVKTKELKKLGSQVFEWNSAIIVAGASIDVDIENTFPAARVYMPLDHMEVINNSAQIISISLDTTQEPIRIPAYMIKPITKRNFRKFRIVNTGGVNTAANEISIHMKKLPQDGDSFIANLQR